MIIPTFRRPSQLKVLLETLERSVLRPEQTIVVDNDPQCSARDNATDKVQVICAGFDVNLSAARNRGWRESTSDICVFIDDDNGVEPTALGTLIETFSDPLVGLAAPVILYGDTDVIWCGGIEHSPWTGRTRFLLQGKKYRPVAGHWSTDSMPDAFAVRRSVLEEIDGFDQLGFPFYYAEDVLAAAIRERGYSTVVVGRSVVNHFGLGEPDVGAEMLRRQRLGGSDQVRLIARGRVEYFGLFTRGLPRVSVLSLGIPMWTVTVVLGCLVQSEPQCTRIQAAVSVVQGVAKGYFHLVRPRRRS